MRICTLATALAFCLGAAVSARADTAVGDAGHYLSADTHVYLASPAGKAFTVSIHRFQWWIGRGWNRSDMKVRITAPGGAVLVDDVHTISDDGCDIEVPAGPAGAYSVEVLGGGTLNFWYVTSSLDAAVAWTGPGTGDAVRSRWFVCNPFVPRKWHFWVPPGTREFALRAQNCRGRSQREDHGITVLSPRGQRAAVLWGQANPDAPCVDAGGGISNRVQQARILVEPGSAGRFWAVELRMGDSHTYSDINLALDGVPPYLARSPEEWFDPRTGHGPAVSTYDEEEFVQSDRSAQARDKHPLLQHWTPCPALGDPDACEIRCPARIALWNPQDRELKFVIGTYLPRNMFPLGKDAPRNLPEAEHDHAAVRITGPEGRSVLEARPPLLHLHGHARWDRTIRTGKGVATIDVTEAEHFWTYTYPATPLVMMGDDAGDGWRRFRLEAGTARNWYFLVPAGTAEFEVRAAAADATDVLDLQINAPDRTIAALYGNRGERTVRVPEGLDGKVWHVRMDFGGATTFISRLPHPRFPSADVSLDLRGVPAYLAPTWEQWFDPQAPRVPQQRPR